MARNIDDTVRKKISSDLQALASVLEKHQAHIFANPEVLRSSANQVVRGGRPNAWHYEVPPFVMRVPSPQQTFPRGCGELEIELQLEVDGECNPDEAGDGITHLIMDLKVSSGATGAMCAWHFDRHIGDENDGDGEAHPLYHFQHGGKAVEPVYGMFGMSLFLPAPRLPFPPMDAILSIDFVISNFCGEAWRNLRNDTEYLRLLRGAQKQLWRPYMQRLAEWWKPAGARDPFIDRMFPHLA
jgi:hypothetical protein